MKRILLAFGLLASLNVYAGSSSSRVLNGASVKNGSGTLNVNTSGTWTIPNLTDTAAGRASAEALTNKTNVSINTAVTSSSLYLQVANNSTPGLTIKNLGSQVGDVFQILNSAGTPLMQWNSSNQFCFYCTVGTNGVLANMDLRPTVQLNSASVGSAARYSLYVGDPATLATGIGGGIALGFGINASKDQQAAGFIWVTKNNASSGDIGSHLKLATMSNSTSKATVGIELDDASNTLHYGNVALVGSTSGQVNIAAQAAAGTYNFNLPITAGTGGQVLTSQGGGSTAMTWTSVLSDPTTTVGDIVVSDGAALRRGSASPSDLINCSVATSVASSALTVALKDAAGNDPSATSPCLIPFRNATSATGTYAFVKTAAATSVVISSGSTLGCSNATACTLYVYAINNAGTVVLGAIEGSRLDEGSVLAVASTAEGGAGAADSQGVLYTTAAQTAKAIRLLGRITITEATAGTWASNATEVSNTPFDAREFYGFTATHGNDCAFARTATTFGDTAADPSCSFNHTDHNMGVAVASYVVTNDMPGLTFTPPKTGMWEVCFTAAYAPSANSAAIELYDGTTEYCKMGNGNTSKIPATCCAQINLTSTSSVNWWLRTLNETSGTVTIGANGNNGNAINWNVKWLGY